MLQIITNAFASRLFSQAKILQSDKRTRLENKTINSYLMRQFNSKQRTKDTNAGEQLAIIGDREDGTVSWRLIELGLSDRSIEFRKGAELVELEAWNSQ